jgi:hypothetical protein
MAITTQATTVGTTAVPILSAQSYALPGTTTVVVSNTGTAAVFLGGPSVTATTGISVANGTNLVLPATDPGGLWAISALTTNTVVVGVF